MTSDYTRFGLLGPMFMYQWPLSTPDSVYLDPCSCTNDLCLHLIQSTWTHVHVPMTSVYTWFGLLGPLFMYQWPLSTPDSVYLDPCSCTNDLCLHLIRSTWTPVHVPMTSVYTWFGLLGPCSCTNDLCLHLIRSTWTHVHVPMTSVYTWFGLLGPCSCTNDLCLHLIRSTWTHVHVLITLPTLDSVNSPFMY